MSSFDNVIVSLFLRSAGTDMLPIRMWQDVEGQLDVRIAAVCADQVKGQIRTALSPFDLQTRR